MISFGNLSHEFLVIFRLDMFIVMAAMGFWFMIDVLGQIYNKRLSVQFDMGKIRNEILNWLLIQIPGCIGIYVFLKINWFPKKNNKRFLFNFCVKAIFIQKLLISNLLEKDENAIVYDE